MASQTTSTPNNRLLRTFGLRAPILQSGMGGVAGPALAAAVSNAGGLGTLAALRLTPDDLRTGIAAVRAQTSEVFGVNIWLHDDVRVGPDPNAVSDDVVRRAQQVLNEFRPRFDLPLTLARPTGGPDLVDDALEVMIEERIGVFCAAIGVPEASLVERFHRVGSKVISMVATVEDAKLAVSNGVDAVVAQGSEAGGHRSYGQKHRQKQTAAGETALSLVPAAVAAVGDSVPVIAAGGVIDGRGLAAMLSLGAEGVLLGTRFVATQESAAAPVWKQRLLDASTDSTTLTDGFTGQWARVLGSEFTQRWEESAATPPPGLLQAGAGADLFAAAKHRDDDQLQPLYAGSGVAGISDLPSAGEVVERIMEEASQATQRQRSILDDLADASDIASGTRPRDGHG